MRKIQNISRYILVMLLFVFSTCIRPAFSLPVVSEVTSGTATLSTDSSTLTINASDKTIINYSSFDLAAGESVIINLPSVDSSILNRVIGNSATNISGSIVCNGVFILVNERGIYLGSSANIDAASVILSTRDISDTNFLSSKYIFSRISKDQMDTLISNQGTINVHDGGFGILIAGAIENHGVVSAKVGTIALAAGDMVHVDISNTGKISIAIDKAQADTVLDANGNPVTDQIKNTGTLSSPGGVVLMKASAIGGLFEKAINLDGYVKADSYDAKDGLIKIATNEDVISQAEISATRVEIGSAEEGIIPFNVK
jgi:filamentous hemagglutinin family protein